MDGDLVEEDNNTYFNALSRYNRMERWRGDLEGCVGNP